MSLELSGVSHTYRGSRTLVLRDISFSIEPGTVQAIVGPSGSGKTTLLTILGLLIRPTQGNIVLDGRPVPRGAGARAALRAERYGWVFQTVNVLSRRSVVDNASLGLLAKGAALGEARKVALSALAAVGLGTMAERPAHSLSGGELQRLCIARAIAAQPRFLLADEPTGQLDRTTTAEVLDAIIRVRRPETAIVIVTHDPTVAARCDQVWELEDGRIGLRGAKEVAR